MVFIGFAVFCVLIPKFKEIDLRSIITGFLLGVFAVVMGLPHLNNNLISSSAFFVLVGFVPLMYIASSILYHRTRLGGSKLFELQYGRTLISFIWGCILFIPLGLFNAAAGSPGRGITWIDRFWIPAIVPFFSGITEEIWFRLFLINLVYFLCKPVTQKYPSFTILFAVVFSAITFGLGHEGRLIHRVFIEGMLFGFPLGVLYVKRDYEHTIGGHYMINMIPTMMVFLGVT